MRAEQIAEILGAFLGTVIKFGLITCIVYYTLKWLGLFS